MTGGRQRFEAALYTSGLADGIACQLAACGGIYCGPTAIAWIAAVWNQAQGRPYDVIARVRDKRLFADGPRLFSGRLPFFAPGLAETLERETEGELTLSSTTHRRVDALRRVLETDGLPVIVRLACPRLRDGLHYTTLWRCEDAPDGGSHLTWMDNGLYGMRDPGHPAFYKTRVMLDRERFWWGCKKVVQR